MLMYLVSIRTAKVFGPGEITRAENPYGNTMQIYVNWPHPDGFSEWEGYALVVPERDQVWGACKPQLDDGILRAEFEFTPVAIPPKDKQLFAKLDKKPGRIAPGSQESIDAAAQAASDDEV